MNGGDSVWKNRAGPPTQARPMDEIVRDLVMALARRCAADHHAAELRGESACASPSTVDTVPISKTRVQ
jgi:hypothetical protein